MQVKFYATLRDLLGISAANVPVDDVTTVGVVLRDLSERHPALQPKLWNEHGTVSRQITVLLNGRGIEYLNGLDTVIRPGDTLALFPPIGGG